MSIYVRVGSEVISVTGPGHVDGLSQESAIPFEVLREQVARSIARQVPAEAFAADVARARRELSAAGLVGGGRVIPPDLEPRARAVADVRDVVDLARGDRRVVDAFKDELGSVAQGHVQFWRDIPKLPALTVSVGPQGGEPRHVLSEPALSAMTHRQSAEMDEVTKALVSEVEGVPFRPLDPAEVPVAERAFAAGRAAGVASVERFDMASVPKVTSGKFVERRPRLTFEAVRWTGDNFAEVEAWLLANGNAGVPRAESVKITNGFLFVETEERTFRVGGETWFVERPNSELSALLTDEFDKQFALVVTGAIRFADFSTRELAKWRRWAALLLKGDEATDELMRQKIRAVVEAPAVIAVDDVEPMTINDLVVEFAASQRSDQPGEPKTIGDPAPLADYEEAFDDSEVQLDAWARWAASLLGENLRPLRSDPARRRLRLDRDVELRKRVSETRQASPASSPIDDLVVEACARVAHEVYRTALGVSDMRSWDTAPEGDKAQARAATREVLSADVSKTTPTQWHAKWCAEKAADGWRYGPVIDVERKEHPNMLPYEQLPEEQRALDRLFVVAVESTRAAIDALEVAYSVPVLKFNGNITPEQFEKFKRDWEAQLASSPTAWKTPIIDMDAFSVNRLVEYADGLVDSMLGAPEIWGSFREVELQLLLMLEVRAFAIGGQAGAGADSVMKAYEPFVAARVGELASADPLSTQLEVRGRTHEFVAALGEFVASQRSVHLGERPKKWSLARAFKDLDEAGTLIGKLVPDHLVPLFEKHCECRPTNTARFSHSHDCDTDVTNDVRTVLHRVVLSGPDADMYGQRDDHRPATDEEVRAARLRLAELLSKESKQ